jgi:hypothetical protein
MEALHTLEHKGYTIEIHQDEGGESPREWENYSTFVMFHGRYDFGDKHSFRDSRELEAHINRDDVISLPVYMYDHSGITISTTPFSCGWDSGQIGYIFMDAVEAQKFEKPLDILEGDIKSLDQFIRGEVYGYVIIDAEGNDTDSCWGYLGDSDYCLNDAIELVDYYDRTNPKQYELSLA